MATKINLVVCFDQGRDSTLRLYEDGTFSGWGPDTSTVELPRATRKFIGGPVIYRGQEFYSKTGPNVYD